MNRLYFGIFLVALMTLVTELALTRAFDVILIPHLAYMIITCAMFAFGLSGIVATLTPLPIHTNYRTFLSMLAFLLAVSTLSILPISNRLPFDYTQIRESPLVQMSAFGGMYGVLLIPFFLSGLIVTTLIAAYPEKIQSLYFWDLTGAAIGCVILVPILPFVGPGGVLFFAAALAFCASVLFSESRSWRIMSLIGVIIVAVVPISRWPEYIDFREHVNKRGVKTARELGKIEVTRWDPISKIDVIAEEKIAGSPWPPRKAIAYDGGSQGSIFWPFHGDYQKLRDNEDSLEEHFATPRILASHYLKRDTDQKVFIIGSAGGVEIKGALMYGAARVDAVEMVETVVELGKTRYAAYTGNIFNHPKVNVQVGEGRSVLRGSREKFDIIQMYSNHTSSSIAAGAGAMAPVYLQTAEAYREYFTHLTDNGVLHINHYGYPRMVTTAALAWKQLGRGDFQKHVAVFELGEDGYVDHLPTLLIKMKPWTEAEINELKVVFFNFPIKHNVPFRFVENPLRSEESFLSPPFYSGTVPNELAEKVQYRVIPATDDKPYFAFFRKRMGGEPAAADPASFTSSSMAGLLKSQRVAWFLSMDIVHLVMTAVCSLFYAGLFIGLPRYFSNVGRTKWPQKGTSLLYFSCLGSGFIIFELVFIHVFMHFIGFPLYTYATVIFTLLIAAGIGSGYSSRLGVSVSDRWRWPFLGILLSGIGLLVSHAYIFDLFLASATAVRVIIAAALMFPLGFFLGMPFPLGILALVHQPQGAIAWAWGLNGLFTVIGGLASVLLSLLFGFKAALWVAFIIYLIAFGLFSRLRQVSFAV